MIRPLQQPMPLFATSALLSPCHRNRAYPTAFVNHCGVASQDKHGVEKVEPACQSNRYATGHAHVADLPLSRLCDPTSKGPFGPFGAVHPSWPVSYDPDMVHSSATRDGQSIRARGDLCARMASIKCGEYTCDLIAGCGLQLKLHMLELGRNRVAFIHPTLW